MQKRKDMRIIIPEGYFEGCCDGCFFAQKKNKDAEGRIFCKGKPGGYNFPYDKIGCGHYASKIIHWIQMAVFIYIMITVLVVFIEAVVR